MTKEPVNESDRLLVRIRPPGQPVIYQNWGSLLFLHWPLPAKSLRPLIPKPLALDTFGHAHRYGSASAVFSRRKASRPRLKSSFEPTAAGPGAGALARVSGLGWWWGGRACSWGRSRGSPGRLA